MTKLPPGYVLPPWPEAWVRTKRRQRIQEIILCGVFSVLTCLILATEIRGYIKSPVSESYSFSGVPLFTLPISIFLFLYLWYSRKRRSFTVDKVRLNHPGETSGDGLVLDCHRGLMVQMFTLALVFSAMILAVIFFKDIRDTRILGLPGWSVGVLGIVGSFVFIPLTVLFRKRSAIVLTPEGLHRIGIPILFCPWEAIKDIAPMENNFGVIRINVKAQVPAAAFIRNTEKNRPGIAQRILPDLILNVLDTGIDSVLALETIQFYLNYPLARAELGTQAAVDRVQGGAVGTSAGQIPRPQDQD